MTDVCVYLIRHGQTFHNIEGRISGQLEAELTPDGIKQAETTAENLQKTGIPYDAILCSPLSRAKNTAAPIAKALGIPVFYDKGLLELNYGKYENVLLEDMFKETYNPPLAQCGVLIHNGRELREYYQNQNPQFDNIRHPGGESKAEARERFLSTIAKFLNAHPEIKNLCVVAHGAVIRLSLCKILNSTHVKDMGNAEVREVIYSRTDGFKPCASKAA